ncbi:hypothetical protein ACN28S_53410 [Cystobacter fuscus]
MRAVPAIEQSERELPNDYNPPARLANLYRRLNRLDDALAASTRALAKVQEAGGCGCSRSGRRSTSPGVSATRRRRRWRTRSPMRSRSPRCRPRRAWWPRWRRSWRR